MADLYSLLPNFFILGAAKSGTTSLYAYLTQHPDVFFPIEKEPHFFDDSKVFNYGMMWYVNKYYRKAGEHPARGDATPVLHLPITAERIADLYGDQKDTLKFIVMLRDPVDRAWSHYLHRVRFAEETETFQRALELEEERLTRNPHAWVGYFQDGLYAAQIMVWLQYFDVSQFKFLLSQDLKHSPETIMADLFDFLDVFSEVTVNTGFQTNVAAAPKYPTLMRLIAEPPTYISAPIRLITPHTTRKRIRSYFRRKNSKPFAQKPSLDAKISAELRRRYQSDIIQLEKLLNLDLSQWRMSAESE